MIVKSKATKNNYIFSISILTIGTLGVFAFLSLLLDYLEYGSLNAGRTVADIAVKMEGDWGSLVIFLACIIYILIALGLFSDNKEIEDGSKE